MNYAIIGCGLIGKKRLTAMPAGANLVVACDTNLSRAEELVKLAKCGRAVADFQNAVADPQVQVVFVATLNSMLQPIALAAVKAGKHVLVEKPAAISVKELDELEAAAKKTGALVRVGYNHRYHPACLKALELFRSGALGPMMFVRGRYGQGGRIGYEKEWRSDAKLSGGGELIDQGVHLIRSEERRVGTEC